MESLKGVKIEELEDAKITAENEIKSIQDLMQDYQRSLETNTLPNHLNEEVSNEEALNKEVSSDEPPKEVQLASNTKEHDKEKEHVWRFKTAFTGIKKAFDNFCRNDSSGVFGVLSFLEKYFWIC